MRLIVLAATATLAACATVEERTDRTTGTGLTAGSMASVSGAQADSGTTTEVVMTAPEAVPEFYITVPGATGDKTEAARAAAAAATDPMGVGVTLGGELYWLRQVRANSLEFAVAEPQGPQGRGDVPQALAGLVGTRIGCLATGETWSVDGTAVAAIDCN